MGDFTLHTTPYGRPAATLLRERITAAKDGDALRPVTVVVPTNSVGVSVRRLLASGELGSVSAGEGVAGLALLTVYRLAELLGAPTLAAAGRRPVSTPVLAAAVRQVLATQPGCFGEVREHPSTEERLVRAHRELSEVSAGGLDRIAACSTRAADVVRIHRQVRALLQDRWYEEADLMAAATAAVVAGSPLVTDLGTVLVHLPQDLSQPAADLLRAVARHAPAEVIAGRTGSGDADEDLDRCLDRLGLDARADHGVTPPAATTVVSVSDPEEEIRSAVAAIVDQARDGVALDRMAILYPAPEPYARILHDHLTAAAIPYNGHAVRPLSDRVLGRWLLDLLALDEQGCSRPALMHLLNGVPMSGRDGRRVAAGAWERTSREAGVVRGRCDWEAKLASFAADARRRSDLERAQDEPRQWRLDQLSRTAGTADDLRGFVQQLFGRLDAAGAMTTWSQLAAWCKDMAARYLGTEATRHTWPDAERVAADRVEAALDRLAGLDTVGSPANMELFGRTLQLELDSDLGRVGQLGRGVLVGTVSSALGVDLQAVVVVGLAEGVLPTRPRDDSLLPDGERAAAAGELRLRRGHTGVEHRHLLAALASARRRVLVHPRGDQRRSMERSPSRWLLDSCQVLGDGRRELPDDAAWHQVVPSFASRIDALEFPATDQEYRLGALAGVVGTRQLARHPTVTADGVLRRGVELLAHRGGGTFTRFDGDLSTVAERLPSPAHGDRIISPSALETWLTCPHAYFMQYVLRVQPVENPEEVLELDALERGSLLHGVLEEWLKQQLSGSLPTPDTPWPPQARELMRRLAEAACEAVEARGVTGHPLLWRRDRTRLLVDLERFVDHDDARRAKLRLTPLAAERPFGLDGTPPVTVDLADGRTVRIRGRIDRIDRTEDGGIVVTDYKTGGMSRYSDLSDGQPLGDGTKLQLGLYGLAVRDTDAATSVRTEYWFTSTRAGFKRKGYELTSDVTDAVREALRIAVDGIEGGRFPLKPPTPGFSLWTECRFCDPDDLGTTDRYREWEQVRMAPELRDYVAYIEPEALQGDTA